MADVVKEIEFRVNANAAPVSNLKREIAGLQSQSKAAGKQMGGMVPPKLGQQLSQLNERTEKGRQLMMLFGSAAGNAAGQVTYYAGTIAYVIGKFQLWQVAAMGIVGGLVYLGSKLDEIADGQMKKFTDKLIEATDASLKLADANRTYLQGLADTRAGVTQTEVKIRELNAQIQEQTIAAQNLEQEMISRAGSLAKFKGMIELGVFDGDAEKSLKDLARAKGAIAILNVELKELQRIGGIEKGEADLPPLVGLKGKSPAQIAREIAEKEAYAANIKEFEGQREYLILVAQLEAEASDYRAEQHRLEWEERERIMQEGGDEALRIRLGQLAFEQAAEEAAIDAKIAAIKKAEKEKEDIWQASIAASEYVARAVSNVADAVGASEKAKMIAVAIFTGITDTINAAHEYAEAAKYFAGAYTAALGAAHLAAAVMYTTSAALAFSKAGGAGGGGGGGGGSGRVGGGGGYGDSGRRDYGDDDRRGRVVTINVEGHVLTAGSAAGFIRAALDAAEDRAHPGRTRSEVA